MIVEFPPPFPPVPELSPNDGSSGIKSSGTDIVPSELEFPPLLLPVSALGVELPVSVLPLSPLGVVLPLSLLPVLLLSLLLLPDVPLLLLPLLSPELLLPDVPLLLFPELLLSDVPLLLFPVLLLPVFVALLLVDPVSAFVVSDFVVADLVSFLEVFPSATVTLAVCFAVNPFSSVTV